MLDIELQESTRAWSPFFWPEDGHIPNSCLSIESEIDFASCDMASGVNVKLDSHLAGDLLRSSVVVTKDSVKAERDRLMEELNSFTMENEQIKTQILWKDEEIKAISICLVDIKRKLATEKAEKSLPAKSDADLLSSARRKGAKSARTRNNYSSHVFWICSLCCESRGAVLLQRGFEASMFHRKSYKAVCGDAMRTYKT